MKVIILILAAIILTGITTFAQQNIIDSLIHQGYQRNYTLHLPTSYNNSKSTPLVVFLHGGGGNALSAQRFTGFNQVSNQYSFLVAYPEAHYESKPNSFIWADGRNTAADKSGIDDIGFINKLLDTLIFDYNIGIFPKSHWIF